MIDAGAGEAAASRPAPGGPAPGGPGRFGFGANWREFAGLIDDRRIEAAEQSLRERLGRESLVGTSFLDAGCGSGLFSLAAARLGAERVRSFDYDDDSVAATLAVKRRHLPGADSWLIERGDVLDPGYLATLGRFDVVYSWGVLHHTGDMLAAMGRVAELVAPGGQLFIALYNDQGRRSRAWLRAKQIYNRLPRALRSPYVVALMGPRYLAGSFVRRLRGRGTARPGDERGMSYWHDIVDWVGGYPFEVASPELVFSFYRSRGFALESLTTVNGWGCNEYVFRAC